jgi:hypothetical protein
MVDPLTSDPRIQRCLEEQASAAAFLASQPHPTQYQLLWVADWLMEETILRLEANHAIPTEVDGCHD